VLGLLLDTALVALIPREDYKLVRETQSGVEDLNSRWVVFAVFI
jgi:hypothetical protein